jgi:hypothetical protein
MKDGKMVLMAQLLLESRTGAYLEWLVNELLMIANKKIEYKDAPLVMLPAVVINHKQIALHILRVFSFLLTGKSCGI